MCFSATTSFGAGIILSAISIATIKKAEKPEQIYFANIPLLFCIQQFAEGLIWVFLTNSIYYQLQELATYAFLFLAQIVWPLLIPFSLLMLEKDEKPKKYLKILLGIGMLVSFYLAYCLISYDVEAKIIGAHISYRQNYPIRFGNYGDLLYIIATIAPPLISSIKRMWILGAVIFISYLITALFYADYIISVWCFFASIISLMVYILIYSMEKPDPGSNPNLKINH